MSRFLKLPQNPNQIITKNSKLSGRILTAAENLIAIKEKQNKKRELEEKKAEEKKNRKQKAEERKVQRQKRQNRKIAGNE